MYIDQTPLNKIKKFCSEYKDAIINQTEIDYMYRRFNENLLHAVENHETKSSKKITEKEYNLLRDSLLSNNNLEMLYTSAHTYYNRMENDIKISVKKDIDSISFWKSIGASMLSNFLYTVIIVIVVFFGKDYVNDLIDSFKDEPPTHSIKTDKSNVIEGNFEEVNDEE